MKINLKKLVKTIEKYTDLTYTDYETDENEEEQAVERLNTLPDILRDLERKTKDADAKFDHYMTALTKLVEKGIADDSITVVQDTTVKNLYTTNLYILHGTLNLTGTATLNVIATKVRKLK